MLIGIIIGVCAMSLFAFFAVWALDEGKEELALILTGPVMWVWMLVGKTGYTIYKKVSLWYFRRNYSRCQFYIRGQLEDTYYIRNDLIPNFYTDKNNNPDYIKVMATCEDAKALPWRKQKVNGNGTGRKNKYLNSVLAKAVQPYTDFYRKLVQGG